MAAKTFYRKGILFSLILLLLTACAGSGGFYRDSNMDFGSVQTIAVMPFINLSRDNAAADRVRDVFLNKLLATGAVYVVPYGEVAKGVGKAEIANAAAPSPEEVVKLAGLIKVSAIITGVVREYGEVRSGTSAANAISMSLQMMEGTTGKVVWTASSTKGGINMWDRLFGGGGRPMNDITESAVNDVINKMFK